MHTLTRRSVLTGTLATSIALALAACSDDGGGADSSVTIAPDTKAELTLAYWDKSQTPRSTPISRASTRPTPISRSPRT